MEGGLEAGLKAGENFDYYNIIIFFCRCFLQNRSSYSNRRWQMLLSIGHLIFYNVF